MSTLSIVIHGMMVLVILHFIFSSSRKIRKLSSELENLQIEHGKMSFQLFVTETKLKSIYEMPRNEQKIS